MDATWGCLACSSTMRAWTVREFGHHDRVLRLEEAADLACPDDGVVVAVQAIGVSFPDVLMVQGKYQVRPPLPFVPGHEVVGIVKRAGPQSRHREGKRVLVFAHTGCYADAVAAPDSRTLD